MSAVSPVASSSRGPPPPASAPPLPVLSASLLSLDVPPSEAPTSPGSYAGASMQGPPSPSVVSVASETADNKVGPGGKRIRKAGPKDPIVFKTPKPGYVVHAPDGAVFTRAMIQYDLLEAIFTDETKAFSPPPGAELQPDRLNRLLTFRECYEESYLCSNKITKRVKDSIRQDQEFGKDHLMVAFLVNVGKINTTAAFYPEMKTLIRHYHSIPVIQKTELSKALLQDSPRLKACLRGVEIPSDAGAPPYTLAEVEARSAQGVRPSTSIINILFTFTGASTELGARHLPRGLDFFDLLTANDGRHTIPSVRRSKAILWLIWRYYEGSQNDINMFEDHHSALNSGQTTHLPDLGAMELANWRENRDLDEELQWGFEMEDKRKADMVILKETGGVGRGKKGEKRPAFYSSSTKPAKKARTEMDEIEAELDAASVALTDAGGEGSSVMGDRTVLEDEDELDEEIDELMDDVDPGASSPVKPDVGVTLLDLSYYMAPPVELPPREKRLLHLAFAKARQTMDDPLYNSEDEDELDDQAVHDLSIERAVLEDSRRINGHLNVHPLPDNPLPVEPESASASPASGTPVPKLRLTFGGGKKPSLSSLLN